jgi:hypothetical protein
LATQVEILNAALTRIGAATINDINELSEEARRCNAVWEIVYHSLLSQATWNFALREVVLAEVVGQPSLFGYKHVYQLPPDMFKLVHVYEDSDFKVIGNKLHTNLKTCTIRYTSDKVDTSAWSPQFTELVAVTIAAQLAYVITKSGTLGDSLQAEAARKLAIAKAHDGADDIPERLGGESSELLSTRWIE